jgi:phosphoribosylaminoimidazolecarboxamide formyltransferase/IMP cyclohydrolase
MTTNRVELIDDQVKIETILISVSDKKGLDTFIPELVRLNPAIRILSTGGTYKTIRDILGEKAEKNLIQVSDYTGQPETQGGLVKTLDFKIYLGLLTETYNPSHQDDLKRLSALPIDMVVVNLYPFKETIAKDDVTPEAARSNIDIGGPTMVRASAKNFIRVASVVDPLDYPAIIAELIENKGCISLKRRFELARKAFAHTAEYDREISAYLAAKTSDDIALCYRSQS